MGKLLEDTGGSDDDESYIGGCGAGKVFNSERFFLGRKMLKQMFFLGKRENWNRCFNSGDK